VARERRSVSRRVSDGDGAVHSTVQYARRAWARSGREQAGPLDRQATKRQGPGDIYNVLRSPEGVVDEEEPLDCR
jgi:hypothetical protein